MYYCLTLYSSKSPLSFSLAKLYCESLQLVGDDIFCLWFQCVQSDVQHPFARIVNETDGTVVLAIL